MEEEANDGSDDFCAVCGGQGLLVCCETCPEVYHPQCLGMDDVRHAATLEATRRDTRGGLHRTTHTAHESLLASLPAARLTADARATCRRASGTGGRPLAN